MEKSGATSSSLDIARLLNVTTFLLITTASIRHALNGFQADSDLQLNQEMFDKIIWLEILLFTFLSILFSSKKKTIKNTNRSHWNFIRQIGSWILPLVTTGILFVSSIALDPIPDTFYWFGFGQTQGLLTLAALIALAITLRFRFDSLNKLWRTKLFKFILLIAFCVEVIWYFPLLIQPVWGLMDPGHSIYSLNDLLAVVNGSIPLVTYSAQYTSLLGFPLRIFSESISSNFPIVATLYLSLLTIICMGILVYISSKFKSLKLMLISGIIIIPTVLTSAASPHDNTSITSMFSALPLRMLSVLILPIVLVRIAQNAANHLNLYSLLLGFLIPAVALNNFEFGIPAVLTSVFIFLTLSRTKESFFLLISGMTLSYVSIFILLGNENPSTEHWLLFTKAFGSGFGAAPMPEFGLYVFVMAVLSVGAIIGSKELISKSGRLDPRSSVLTAYFGLTGLGCFGYYIGRSMVPTQLQIFFLFCSPIVVVIFRQLIVELSSSNTRSSKNLIKLLPSMYIVIFCLFSILQAPSFSSQVSRVVPTAENMDSKNWPLSAEMQSLKKDWKYSSEMLSVNAPILAMSGQYQGLQFGAKSINPFSSPADYVLSSSHLDMMCKQLKVSGDYIIVSSSLIATLPALLDSCNQLTETTALPNGNFLLKLNN